MTNAKNLISLLWGASIVGGAILVYSISSKAAGSNGNGHSEYSSMQQSSQYETPSIRESANNRDSALEEIASWGR